MKINGNGLEVAPVSKTREVEGPQKSAALEKTVSKDDVALSSDASGLSNVSLGEAPRGAGNARMKQLADALASGTYKVDRQKLAAKIIGEESGS